MLLSLPYYAYKFNPLIILTMFDVIKYKYKKVYLKKKKKNGEKNEYF